MPRYEYKGEVGRTFPTLGITVKKGDTFDAPEGFTAQGVSLVSSKSAPAEKQEIKKETASDFLKELKAEVKEEKPSAPSDQNAGA